MNAEAREIIAALGLQPLAGEGGFFRRTWESGATLPPGRPVASAIYYLLPYGAFSALHSLDADETWHYHAGDALEHVQFDVTTRRMQMIRLGGDIGAGECPQVHVPAGVWQGARLAANAARGWSLVGCTVTPAWEQSGFVLGAREFLTGHFPGEAGLIRALTR